MLLIIQRYEQHNVFPLYHFRQATTDDDELHHTEAQALCKDLHPRSVLPMPNTPAQLDVLKSFMTTTKDGESSDWDNDHVGIDVDASGNVVWRDDGSAFELSGSLYNGEKSGYASYAGYDCGDNYEFKWSNDGDIFGCYGENNSKTKDGKQLCQLTLNPCDEAEQ